MGLIKERVESRLDLFAFIKELIVIELSGLRPLVLKTVLRWKAEPGRQDSTHRLCAGIKDGRSGKQFFPVNGDRPGNNHTRFPDRKGKVDLSDESAGHARSMVGQFQEQRPLDSQGRSRKLRADITGIIAKFRCRNPRRSHEFRAVDTPRMYLQSIRLRTIGPATETKGMNAKGFQPG